MQTALEDKSLPVRERGLKRSYYPRVLGHIVVAPRAGAWIETRYVQQTHRLRLSLPVRERGLKRSWKKAPLLPYSRSPCGSVD